MYHTVTSCLYCANPILLEYTQNYERIESLSAGKL